MVISVRLNFEYNQVLREINKRIHQKETGQLMLAAKSSFASFGFCKGQIVSASYGVKKGLDAVEAIVNFAQAGNGFSSLNFIPSATVSHEAQNLPQTEVLISQMEQGLKGRAVPELSSRLSPGVSELSLTVKAIFEQALINQIGPMAKIICSGVWSNCDSIDQAIVLLSREIPDPGDQQAFIKEVFSKLKIK